MTIHRFAVLAAFASLWAPAASAETYYARNPNNDGRLTMVGFVGGTTFEVRALPGNALRPAQRSPRANRS